MAKFYKKVDLLDNVFDFVFHFDPWEALIKTRLSENDIYDSLSTPTPTNDIANVDLDNVE